MLSQKVDEKLLNKLDDGNPYQVYLLVSPIPLPLSFAVHGWFVTRAGDEISRYEFGKFGGSPHPNGIGLLKDFLKPTVGMNLLPGSPKWRHKSYLKGMISGDADSIAAELAFFLENKSEYYPHKKHYRYLGPNSNTYIGWVLSHFPQCGLKLPVSAVGKNYPAKPISYNRNNQPKLVDLGDG